MHYFEFRLSFVLNILTFHKKDSIADIISAMEFCFIYEKMPRFRLLTTLFGGFKGVFSYKTDKSAVLCPGKTEAADFVRLRVQSFKE